MSKNKNLKWCPRPDCGLVVRRPGCCRNQAQCECGELVCFKCGGSWHTGRCQYEGGLAFKAWQAMNPTVRCPGCRIPLTKNGGCNHMKCTRCYTDWCWLCRMKTPQTYAHFDSLFGCYGMQDGCGNYYVLVLLLLLLRLLILPFIVYFVVMERLLKSGLWMCFGCCIFRDDDRREEKYFMSSLLIGLIFMPIMLVIGIVASVPVVVWNALKVLYSFSCRYIFCCCC